MNIREMTTCQLRDWLAERDGWNPPGTPCPATYGAIADAMNSMYTRDRWWRKLATGTLVAERAHPHPSTLDGAAAAMPEGVRWYRDHPAVGRFGNWGATRGDKLIACVPDTGDEKHDRFLLAALCREASGS